MCIVVLSCLILASSSRIELSFNLPPYMNEMTLQALCQSSQLSLNDELQQTGNVSLLCFLQWLVEDLKNSKLRCQ